MASNTSVIFDLPPLPSYTLTPRSPVLAPIPDNILALILPIVAYWGLSMVYHFLDIYDLFPQYRLHTPAELIKRNHVTRWEVVRDVLLQQVVQTLAGVAVGYFDEVECTGKEEYDVAVWARRLRFVQKALPILLGLFGIDALGLAKNLSTNGHTALAGALAGGKYPGAVQSIILENGVESLAPAFTEWEMTAANFIYWYFVPFIQFTWAITVLDTWQYFWHRAMHLNRWLYGKFLDSSKNTSSDKISQIPFPSPSPLCSVRLWCSVQPSCGGFPSRHSWHWRGLLDRTTVQPSKHVVLHDVNHQDSR